MPNKQARSGQSAVPFEMSTRNRSYHDLRTPQSADEQLDLNERSESFEAETTPNPQDDNDEAVLDPQTTNDLIRRLQDQINRLQGRLTAPQYPPALTSQSDRAEREQERIRKLAKERFAGREPIRLKSRENYATWRDNLLLEAHWIEAKSILANVEISPPSYEPIEVARWQKQNEILHSRILLSLDERIRSTIDWHESTSAAHFWRELSNIYGISTAEERLMTVKALLDLHPQGDYVGMLYDYQRLVAKLKQMKITLEDLFHDMFICLLG
jgi:hypothetical protein